MAAVAALPMKLPSENWYGLFQALDQPRLVEIYVGADGIAGIGAGIVMAVVDEDLRLAEVTPLVLPRPLLVDLGLTDELDARLLDHVVTEVGVMLRAVVAEEQRLVYPAGDGQADFAVALPRRG